MKGYFPVDIDHLNSTFQKDYQFLFKSIGKVRPLDLAEALRDSMRRINYPDVVAIVCSPKEADEVKHACETDAHVQQELERASSNKCVVILSLCRNGVLSMVSFVKNPIEDIDLLLNGNYSETIYREGLKSLFAMDTVLVKAPAGFTFLKPSGARSSHFIKPENALSESEDVHFLACSLLRKIEERECEANPIEVIYIDTMAISSLAYTLRDLYEELYECEAKPRVVSFHSYQSMYTVDSPLARTSLCIISASSSMNMERKWLASSGCLQSEVITLLTLKDAKQSDHALHSLPITSQELETETHGRLRDIRILGERFSPEEIEPKQVLLNLTSHKLAEWSKEAPLLSAKKALLAFHSTQQSGNMRPIYADGVKIFEHSREDIKKYILENVPVSTKWVIYQNDEASKLLAEFCAKHINAHLNTSIKINTLDGISSGKIPIDEGLLIVAAVVGRGEALNSISRDLRGAHEGTRRFLVVSQITETKAAVTRFKKNLEQSISGQLIKVDVLHSLAVGMSDFMRLEKEVSLFESLNCGLPAPIKDRINQINKNGTLDAEFFLPSSVTPHRRLTLRPGFAFWDNDYDDAHDHSAAVLSTIAASLQHAREEKSIPDHDRLYSSAFQQVVLDPENFSRFNDGIIQAALLRSSYSWELDYSSIPDASRKLGRLLRGLFQNYQREQGEASLEFALALAVGKLKLDRKIHEELVDFCKNNIQGHDDWCKLLQSLLERSLNPTASDLPF